MGRKDSKKDSGKDPDSENKGEGTEGDSPDSNGDSKDESTEELEPTNRLRLVGLALIGSVIIGYSPLSDAVQGNGSFENAMFRFLACFVVCVSAASILGRILDGAPPPASRAGERTQQETPVVRQTDPAVANETSSESASQKAVDRPPIDAATDGAG